MTIALSLIGAYLLGAIPFGFLIARAHGQDLRRIGSGNIGATNLGRTLGRPWGVCCFALDALKGCLPMVILRLALRPAFLAQGGSEAGFLWLWMAAGALAVLGHVFPIFLGFRGGKGVSTSFGVALGLWPYFTVAAVSALGVWVLVLWVSRFVSLASMVAAASFPLVLLGFIAGVPTWTLAKLWPLIPVATAIPLGVVVLHRDNIRRLRAGTERRIGSGSRDASHDAG